MPRGPWSIRTSALRTVSPQATCADMFVGDDFHHNGAFRLSYSFVASAVFEAEPYMEYWDRWDTYDWFLDLGPLPNVNVRHFRVKGIEWRDIYLREDGGLPQRLETLRHESEPQLLTHRTVSD